MSVQTFSGIKLHKQHAMLSGFQKSRKTSFEAEEAAGVDGGWRRVSELSALGLIEPVYKNGAPVTRPTYSGRPAQVYAITNMGRETLKEWNKTAKSL